MDNDFDKNFTDLINQISPELKKHHKEVARDARNESLAFKKVFLGSEEGKLVLNKLLELCSVRSSIFTGNSRTFYNCGKQDIGLYIQEMINHGTFNNRQEVYEKGLDDLFENKMDEHIKNASKQYDIDYDEIKSLIERNIE